MRPTGTLEDHLRLLDLIRLHLRGDGSGDAVAEELEQWTDDERFNALHGMIASWISLASEVAPTYGLTIEEFVDRSEGFVRLNEQHRQRLMDEEGES